MYVFDPDAHLDFGQNWTEWLHTGETILTVTATVTGPITIDGSPAVVPAGTYGDQVVEAGTTVQAWIDASTLGYSSITFHITTNQGRVDNRTLQVHIKER